MFQDQDIMEDLKQSEASLVKSYASMLTAINCPVLSQDVSLLFNNSLQNLSLVSGQMTDYNWITPIFAQQVDIEQAISSNQPTKEQLDKMMDIEVTPKKQPGAQTTV